MNPSTGDAPEPIRMAPAATEYASTSTSDVTIDIQPEHAEMTTPMTTSGNMHKSIRSNTRLRYEPPSNSSESRLDQKVSLFTTVLQLDARTAPDKQLLDRAEVGRILNDQHNYYNVLKLSRTNLTSQVLSKQYRDLSLMVHPDKNPHRDASKAFLVVSSAYCTLNNAATRALYDVYLGENAHPLDRTTVPYRSWAVDDSAQAKELRIERRSKRGKRKDSTHLPRWLQPVLNTPGVGVIGVGLLVLLALPVLLLWFIAISLWHTLFVPIRACTDVDSEPSYSVGELTDTDNSNASPNESYASDSEMQVQAARARGKGSRQDNLEDTCSHLNSLVQPLTSAKRSGKRATGTGGSLRRSWGGPGKQHTPQRVKRTTTPELMQITSFSSDNSMDALIEKQEQTDLFSLFHNLRIDEHDSYCDLTQSLPTGGSLPTGTWGSQRLGIAPKLDVAPSNEFPTFGTACNPAPTNRSLLTTTI